MRDKFKALIVDEDQDTRELCGKILTSAHEIRVEEATTGAEALTKVERFLPDIVLCNLSMSDMDWLDFVRLVKDDSDSNRAGRYLIVIGSSETDQDRMKVMEEGADAYLTKPITPEDLLFRVKVGQRMSLNLKKSNLTPGECSRNWMSC